MQFLMRKLNLFESIRTFLPERNNEKIELVFQSCVYDRSNSWMGNFHDSGCGSYLLPGVGTHSNFSRYTV